MEPIDAIEKLARAAREEVVPETDLDVRRILRAYRVEPSFRIAPLAWSAAISAIAAVVMLTVALHGNGSGSTTSDAASVDSISPLFNAAQVQMP